MWRTTVFGVLVSVVLIVASNLQAEVVTIEGTIKSVDAKKRTITVETGSESKMLDVSSKAKVSVEEKAANLESLKAGQKVKLSYHDELEIVLKIEVVPNRATEDAEKIVSLFDGKSLKGWKGDMKYWKVVDGAIAGKLPSKHQGDTYLATVATFENFILKTKFKLSEGNSGIQFRGQRNSKNAMSGYSADIAYHDDSKYLGWLWGERAVGKIGEPTPAVKQRLIESVNQDNWNDCVITANGDRISIEINGVKTVDVHHDGPRSGAIGFQLHGGTVMTEVEFKSITIEKLP